VKLHKGADRQAAGREIVNAAQYLERIERRSAAATVRASLRRTPQRSVVPGRTIGVAFPKAGVLQFAEEAADADAARLLHVSKDEDDAHWTNGQVRSSWWRKQQPGLQMGSHQNWCRLVPKVAMVIGEKEADATNAQAKGCE